MTRIRNIARLFAISFLVICAHASATDMLTVKTDLSGNGRLNTVTLNLKSTRDEHRKVVIVRVGKAAYTRTVSIEDLPLPELRIVNLDSKRREKQLLLLTTENGSCTAVLLAYRRGYLKAILDHDSYPVCDSPKILGDGRVFISTWRDFWVYEHHFRLTPSGTLNPEAQTDVFVNVAASAGTGLTLTGAKCATKAVSSGTYLRFVSYTPSTDSYYVEAADGSCGHISAKDVSTDNASLQNVPFAN